MNSDRQVIEVKLKRIQSRHYDDLVDLELMGPSGCGVGKVVTEEDLVLIRDRISDYIRENFPPKGDA